MKPKAARKPHTRRPKTEAVPPVCEPICEECKRLRDIEAEAIKKLDWASRKITDAITCIKGHGYGNAYQYLTDVLTNVTPAHIEIEKLYRAEEAKRRGKL